MHVTLLHVIFFSYYNNKDMGLIKNNASVAADIAVELSHLHQNSDANQSYLKSSQVNVDHGNEKLENKQPVSITFSMLLENVILSFHFPERSS